MGLSMEEMNKFVNRLHGWSHIVMKCSLPVSCLLFLNEATQMQEILVLESAAGLKLRSTDLKQWTLQNDTKYVYKLP